MISKPYAKAYTEVLEIIKYFPEEEYAKIPIEKLEFYKKYRDQDYIFSINPEIDLSEQNISKEANSIIINLFRDYYATEEQKVKIKEILELNQKKEEEKKREKYNLDNIFKNRQNTPNNFDKKDNKCLAVIEVKEKNFLQRIFEKIKIFLHNFNN